MSEGIERKEQITSWVADKKKVSAYAMDLQQIDNGVVIPPSGWRCCKCDKVDNLWLNLTDGMILCGRRNWDGSGGNNHAVEHYNETKYPLAVKLGTITADLEGAGNNSHHSFSLYCCSLILCFSGQLLLTCILFTFLRKDAEIRLCFICLNSELYLLSNMVNQRKWIHLLLGSAPFFCRGTDTHMDRREDNR